jgi:hypothetical protein
MLQSTGEGRPCACGAFGAGEAPPGGGIPQRDARQHESAIRAREVRKTRRLGPKRGFSNGGTGLVVPPTRA